MKQNSSFSSAILDSPKDDSRPLQKGRHSRRAFIGVSLLSLLLVVVPGVLNSSSLYYLGQPKIEKLSGDRVRVTGFFTGDSARIRKAQAYLATKTFLQEQYSREDEFQLCDLKWCTFVDGEGSSVLTLSLNFREKPDQVITCKCVLREDHLRESWQLCGIYVDDPANPQPLLARRMTPELQESPSLEKR